MRSLLSSSHIHCLVLFIWIAIASTKIHACGLDWTVPQNHFDGVDENGHLSYWKQLGQIDIGDGYVVPLSVNFSSVRHSPSMLGEGWIVPLLESRIEPVDENTFKVVMPDGWIFTFLRNGDTDTWRGNSGWLGEKKDNIVKLSAPCGWSLSYNAGIIQAITTPKGNTVSYTYFENGGVKLVNEANIPLITFTHAEKQTTIETQTFSISVTTSASSYAVLYRENKSHQINKQFSFEVSKTDGPAVSSLKITKEAEASRYFGWITKTGCVCSDGDWTYTVSSSNPPTITRINGLHKQSYCAGEGEITEETDGLRTITTFFSNSGILAHHLRSIITMKDGKTVSEEHYTYDERGALLRITRSDGVTTTCSQPDALGCTTSTSVDSKGQVKSVVKADSNNNVISYSNDDSTMSTIKPSDAAWSIKSPSIMAKIELYYPSHEPVTAIRIVHWVSNGTNRPDTFETDDDLKNEFYRIDQDGHVWADVRSTYQRELKVDGRIYEKDLYDINHKVIQQQQYNSDGKLAYSTTPNENK